MNRKVWEAGGVASWNGAGTELENEDAIRSEILDGVQTDLRPSASKSASRIASKPFLTDS